MKKYVVYPGWVVSRTDGDRHFISSTQLMELHGVTPSECVVMRSGIRPHGISKDLISLFPRTDGSYRNYGREFKGKVRGVTTFACILDCPWGGER